MDNKITRFFNFIKNKKVAFCGIGGSNLPLIKMFSQKDAIVSAHDRRNEEQLGETANELKAMGVKLCLGEDYLDKLDADIIFRTPGMKYYLPQLNEARKKGAAVTSEMEVFFDLCPCKIYAITGSDGKTTTSTLISEMLKRSGKTVHLGGNIGKPLLPEIENINENDVAVVELSSFQLISMRKSPDVAVVTNLAPNHLDVHASMQEYVDSKKNILLHQNAFSRTVLNLDNEITLSFAEETRGETLFFSRNNKTDRGFYLENDFIVKDSGEKVLNINDIKIPGWHNVENYMAAIAAVWGEVSIEEINDVAKNFGGVEHRNELVRVLDGVSYYNDSIGSSPSRTIGGALSLYDKKIILIAGGYDKKIPYEPLGEVIPSKVKELILIGATAPKIEEAVKNAKDYSEGNPNIYRAESMQDAVNIARKIAKEGDIVSLSPASASFDMYPNFEVRGRHFKQLVNEL